MEDLPTPSFVIDLPALKNNLRILHELEDSTGVRVLLAQKAFSAYALYPLLSGYLSGTTASGLFEARLAHEHFRGENHVYSPAYKREEAEELCTICDHICCNSLSQLEAFRLLFEQHGVSVGLRVNPEFSTQSGHPLYDPCAPGSRLGVTAETLSGHRDGLRGVSGLHFHTLCEQGADALCTTFDAFERKFGAYLPGMKWLNLGGGHHITRPGYDLDALRRLLLRIRRTYGVTVYLEPGEAVALNAGFLVTTVLDTVQNGGNILLLDTSAACHMPDVLEMPYRPPLAGSGLPHEKKYTCTLAGRSCLSGDVIGEYSFDALPVPGDRLVFEDMAIYSMVKTNTFNGMPLPSIYLREEDGSCTLLRQFGYRDFKERL